MKKDNNTIELTLNPEGQAKRAIITIKGDSDLVLNKMNARLTRILIADDRKAVMKQTPNVWEDIITSIHWRDPLECKDTYTECDEAMMHKLLQENAPCITAFGLQKSFGLTVYYNKIDKNSKGFNSSVNIDAPMGKVPVKFESWAVDDKLMSPQRGAPITVHLNHFMNWEASFVIKYLDHVFSLNEIVNIINLAGFGSGIGSGRSSGYGRYHVTKVAE